MSLERLMIGEEKKGERWRRRIGLKNGLNGRDINIMVIVGEIEDLIEKEEKRKRWRKKEGRRKSKREIGKLEREEKKEIKGRDKKKEDWWSGIKWRKSVEEFWMWERVSKKREKIGDINENGLGIEGREKRILNKEIWNKDKERGKIGKWGERIGWKKVEEIGKKVKEKKEKKEECGLEEEGNNELNRKRWEENIEEIMDVIDKVNKKMKLNKDECGEKNKKINKKKSKKEFSNMKKDKEESNEVKGLNDGKKKGKKKSKRKEEEVIKWSDWKLK